jgi:hypothetical protein
LLLHPKDKDDDAYVLMVGLNGRYRVAGWILAGAGKQDTYWKNDGDRSCFWVPQQALALLVVDQP